MKVIKETVNIPAMEYQVSRYMAKLDRYEDKINTLIKEKESIKS